MPLLLDDPMWTECAASLTLPPDISPRRLISRPDREDDPSGEGRHPGGHAVVEEVMP
jgi:hypothetical protein